MAADDTTPTNRIRDSVRVVIEALAVASIIWLANSMTVQSVAMAKLTVQVTQLQATLTGIPTLAYSVAQLQSEMQESQRRTGRLEDAQVSRDLHSSGASHR